MSGPVAVESEALRAANVRHAFFTRRGGDSSGLYAGNNCGYGTRDDAAVVTGNRHGCAAHLGLATLVTVHQKHTPNVVQVETPWTHDAAPIADAMVTARPGLALGILTADCAPVLLADPSAGVIGAAHAGWRGAFDGVLQATVAAMADLGARPDRIVAAVGPCIAAASYEVGPEFIDRFVTRDAAQARYFTNIRADGHGYFDLSGFVADTLTRCGVGTIARTGDDTCADAAGFFSFRRSVLRGEADYGRQLSAIGLAT